MTNVLGTVRPATRSSPPAHHPGAVLPTHTVWTAPKGDLAPEADRAWWNLNAVNLLILFGPDADLHHADFVTSQYADRTGALVFACLLHLAGDIDGARLWWRFAVGADHHVAEYCTASSSNPPTTANTTTPTTGAPNSCTTTSTPPSCAATAPPRPSSSPNSSATCTPTSPAPTTPNSASSLSPSHPSSSNYATSPPCSEPGQHHETTARHHLISVTTLSRGRIQCHAEAR